VDGGTERVRVDRKNRGWWRKSGGKVDWGRGLFGDGREGRGWDYFGAGR
jgi:hypothetical protein